MRIRALACATALFAACAAQAAQADEGADLLRKKGCGKCHALASSKDAISLKEIAAKYRGQREGHAALGAEFRKTKDHARMRVSDAELKALADYILTLK
jgi:cytochrome c551/c552